MKVGLIGDVHGNLPALEAVLEALRGAGIEALWNVGDLTGYGPFPNEVIERLRAEGAVSIIGNYDQKVLAFPRKKETWRRTKGASKFLAFRWTYENLSPESRAYLGELPVEKRLKVQGHRILLTHGSPAAIDEALGPETSAKRFKILARLAQSDVVACGHTHRAFTHEAEGVLFVNPGSVGRPEGDDPRASYALLEIGEEGIDVSLRREDYDIERTVRTLRGCGLPDAFGAMLQSGQNLDGVGEPDSAEAEFLPAYPEERAEPALQAVLDLARRCQYEARHTHQVTRLALRLFDELGEWHGLGEEERFWLECGALLHDIGWSKGQKGHHKAAFQIIMKYMDLPFPKRERRIIALIARYHRKAPPHKKHRMYAELERGDRERVRVLAGLLRVADGLDRTHLGLVHDLGCKVSDEKIVIQCQVDGPFNAERWAGMEKGRLLAEVFHRQLAIEPI